MKIKFLLITVSLFIYSCSSDEKTITENPKPIEEILQPEISTLSTDFIIEGETLTIEGNNFINNSFDTKLVINNETYDVTPVSNSKINVEITNSMGIENSSIFVKISDKASELKNFFIVPKGWHQIETDLEILKAFIFDDTNTINTFIDTQSSSTSFFGDTRNIEGNSNGYQAYTTNTSGVYRNDFKMFNKDIGVSTDPNSGYFTSNAFEESKSFGNFIDDGEFVIETYITHIDANGSIIVNCCGAHIMTNDRGETSSSANASEQLFSEDRLRVKACGKGSDNYFYEFGIDIGSNPFKNYVIKSINGFNNWELVNNTVDLNFGGKTHFVDFDLIFNKTSNDELQISNDLTDSWNIIKTNVQSFFIKNRTNWFIVSDNKLYSTNDSGTNWNLELELPIDSEVNHMSFATNKMLISGKNLLYVKHE
ncbi:IPT/TIG domain-containing protein [Flavobacteriaceae bacterium]|nr:IPT/TIG domain-containing protein [Flavobacteriaceae bacterium]